MSASHDPQQMRHPTFMQYVWIAIILFVVTLVEFVLIYDKAGIADDLGQSKIPLLIVLSAFKFAIVIMFYMHLKYDNRLLSGIFVAGLALAFIVGLALVGLFVTFGAEPREFAKAHAVPYVEEGHEPVGGESKQPDEEGATPAEQEPAAASGGETGDDAKSESEAPQVAAVGALAIGVVGDTLEFDQATLNASAGSEVVFTFTNASALNQHNWVLVQTGTKDAVAADGTAAGPNNDWIPPNDARVIAHTALLEPGETEEIRFTLDAGTYEFVCTFPGHNFTMFGDFEVADAGEDVTAQAVAEAPSASASLEVGVEGDALQFNTDSLTSSAGTEVVITFSNTSTLNQHNWVLVQTGTKDAVATDGTAAGPDNNWIPPNDARVIAHTALLAPGETEEIRFTLDAGTYQFVCTFPGHNFTMFGDFEVTP